MSKDAVKKILLIEREQRRRKKGDRLALYNAGDKVHEKQLAFHRCRKKNRWIFGGNRSGKTECGAVEAVYMARGVHPYRKNKPDVKGWIVSLSSQVQRDVAQRKFLQYLDPRYIVDVVMSEGRKDSPETGVIDLIIIRNAFGGTSEVGFKSCDQGREKFQGTSLDFVWFDEEPPKDIYDECKMRVFDRQGDIFGTMTPLKGMTFVYDEIYLNKYHSREVWCEFMEWADNPFLSESEIKRLTESMSDDVLESRRYGRFAAASGLVYKEFDENRHVIEPFDVPEEWYATLSIDPGLNNPLSCHFYAVDYDGNVYVIAEHFEAGREISYHAEKIKAIAARLNWKKDAFGRIEALIDSAANQHTLSGVKSVTELFFEHGIAVNPKVDKNLFSGIARVKEYLKSGKLYIFSSCVNLIREMKSYYWKDSDAPIKRDDHALDELRYFISSRPISPEKTEVKTPVQLDKERLIRKLKRRNR